MVINNMTNRVAAFEAVNFSIEAGFQEIELEGDNLGVFRILFNKKTDIFNAGVVISNIFDLVSSC